MNKKKDGMNMDDLIKQSALESENKIKDSMKEKSQDKGNRRKKRISLFVLTVIMVLLMACSIVYNFIRLDEISRLPEMSREDMITSAKIYVYYVNYKIDTYFKKQGQYPGNLESVNETGAQLKYTQYEEGYELHYHNKIHDIDIIFNSKDDPNILISRLDTSNDE